MRVAFALWSRHDHILRNSGRLSTPLANRCIENAIHCLVCELRGCAQILFDMVQAALAGSPASRQETAIACLVCELRRGYERQ